MGEYSNFQYIWGHFFADLCCVLLACVPFLICADADASFAL